MWVWFYFLFFLRDDRMRGICAQHDGGGEINRNLKKRGKMAEIFCLEAQSLDRGEKNSRRKSEAGNYIA